MKVGESADHLLTDIGQDSLCAFFFFYWFLYLKRKRSLATLVVPSKSVNELSLSLWLETLSSALRFVSSLAREQGVGRMLLNIAQTFLPLNG